MTDPLMSQRTNGGGGNVSAGLTWPRRGRPQPLSFRPLRCVNAGRSPEGNMDVQPFLSPPIQQRSSGYVSPLRAVRTLKEYDQEIDNLRKENFSLKLQLYFLENDMEKITNSEERETLKVNVQLRIETESLKTEVMNKATMLHEAMVALEKLEEKHRLEMQHQREIQMQLEEKVEALKQELDKERMQTPRSSETGSEIYRQAFGIPESLSGKSSPENELSWGQTKSYYLAELEKLQCTVDEKEKEIKNMGTVIKDLEQNNKVFEEKVRKRNIAIQGLFQIAKKKENSDSNDQPQGFLHKSLMQAIEAAHTGSRESVISNLDNIKKGLSELLSVPGSEVTLSSSEDFEHLKSEISKKDQVIQKSPLPSNAILEQECARLQKAVREKDKFIRDLLDERTKMTLDHQETVQSLVCQLKKFGIQSESARMKDSDIYGSESLKMLQELICEKDAEINMCKKNIDLLNIQLTKCKSELEVAIVECNEKELKLSELSSQSIELQKQLTEIHSEMQALKATQRNSGSFLTRDTCESRQSDEFLQCNSAEISKPLINFDDSLKSTSVAEKKHASLTEIKELQKSLEQSMPSGGGSENVDSHIQRSSSRNTRIDDNLSPNAPSVSNVPSPCLTLQKPSAVQNKKISETICVKTPRNETIKLSLNVSKRIHDIEDSETLLNIMANNIEDFEHKRLLKQLEDQNVEMGKLGRHATLQADMASVLAADKKHLQQEIEEKTSEIQMLTTSCNELEKQVISMQSELHTAVKRAEELERIIHDSKSKPKTPIPKSSAAVQTCKTFTRDSGCCTTFSDVESNLTNFGQTDSVNTLRGEICFLILMVEEKDKEIVQHKQSITKLKSDLKNMALQCGNTSQLLCGYTEDVSVIHHQLTESQDVNHNLLEHLQEVARFMETLLSGSGGGKLNTSSLTLECVSSAVKHISESIALSESLCHNLTTCEESRIFDPNEYSRIANESLRHPPSEFLRSDRMSFETDDLLSSSRRAEGSEIRVVPLHPNENRTGKSWKWSSVMQHKATVETVSEPVDSDQLTILGDSCSEEEMCCLNAQKVPDVAFRDEVQVLPVNENCRTVTQKMIQIDARKNYLNCVFEDSSMRLKCNVDQEHILPLSLRLPPEAVLSLLPFKAYQRHNNVPCYNISSDSDIWSEPDRNLSLQRIGIDLEAPSFHIRSPPKRRRSTRDRQLSDDCSSDSSFSVNGIPKGRSGPRRKKSTGSFSRRDTTEPKLDALVESRLLTLERSIEDKLAYVHKLSQTVQDDVSGLVEIAGKSPDKTQILMNINEEIYNLQSTLANAVEEVKILKDTTKESSQLSQDRNLTEELKLYNEEILSKIDDIEQMKEILVKERCARESAEQNLYLCHQELLSVKQKLHELQAKTVTKHDQEFISQKKIQEFQQEASHIPEVTESASDVDLLRESLAQEEERNVVLNKQMNDIINENKKLKIELEQLQFRLVGEQKDLEDIRQELKSEQEMVKQLNKEKNATESKNVDLAADIMHVKDSLTELHDQNNALNKQICDLMNENRKLKLTVEMSEVQLHSEHEQVEKLNEDHLHKQEMVKQLNKEKNATESKNVALAADIMRVKASLTELQDHNEALNKQIGDLMNENRKLKLTMEKSEVQLHSEHEQLEKLNEEHMHKQESLNQLLKDKLVSQNEIVNLTSEVETLKIALSQKEEQISRLSKQVGDLHNDNWSVKKELEQLEQNLWTEKEHLDALHKVQKDLHKQNVDSTAEKADLEKRLYDTEERLKVLADEKSDLSKQIFEEQRENKNLLDKVSLLEEQKAILVKENTKCKTEMHHSGTACDETRFELKQAKDKLKKLELKLHQYESELTKVTSSNEHLLSEKESLREELESASSKLADLNKQNSEMKKMLKEKISSYKEIERERSLLVDHIESLKTKKVQAESSRDKLLSDYDSLATKVESLERQLKDGDLNVQKNKDEQEHLKQQVTSLQNKIKLKESIVKELEEQHDVLHEQLKDLQHSLNKNGIDLKHLEDENHSLELQSLTLQKQLKKASSLLEAKDGEISHLQEDIFNLEQKIKDKDTIQKRMLDEKKASEDQVQYLQQEIKKQDSFHKQMKQQAEELEEHISGLEQQLQSKELQKRKSEEEVKSLQAKVEEKEKSVKKLESTLKKMEHKLSSSQDTNMQLQHKVKLTETARKFSEDQTEVFREELNKLREAMLTKTRTEEPASTDRLSTVIEQLNAKDEYCRALENKVVECQKQILSLQREYDRVTTLVAQSSETGRMQPQVILTKVFSEPRSSQDYRHHTEIKEQSERDNMIKEFEFDISDLKQQIEVLRKKLHMAEEVKRELEDENISLWKTLYGSQDEKTDIIKTLENKSNDSKNQVEELEKKLETSEKHEQELEEDKNSLWKTLYEKEGEDVDLIKRLEQKNKELKDQLQIFQTKLKAAEKSKEKLREEKDSLYKTIHGKKDVKSEVIRNLQLKNNDFKDQIGDLQKKLNATEKAKCEFEEEKNSLWKTLYGKHDENTDVTKMLEGKNNELKLKVEVLEKKLSHCEKARFDIEEKKNTLWKTLHGSQDEKNEAMKMMEEKNKELKNQIAVLEKEIKDAGEARVKLEEEKNSMWKTLCGSDDEKTDLLQQMEMKNVDLKGEMETLKSQLISSEKAHKETEEEKTSLWKTLYGTEHEKSDIIRSLEVKNSDLKRRVQILQKKLDASEEVKKDLESRIHSLRTTLYGGQDEKNEAVRTIELKNSDLLAQVEVLTRKVSDLEKDKNEIEEEKASLWRTVCGSEDEKTGIMRRMEQKSNDLSNLIQDLEKKLQASDRALKEVQEEKTSLWKTLHGSAHEQGDIIRKLEERNKDLNAQIEQLAKNLSDAEKAKESLGEEKNSLWIAVHGSDDEKTHEIQVLEVKNSDLRGEIESIERKLSTSEKLKHEFEDEKNSLWKNMYGSQDEKAATIKKLNMEISDLKSLAQNLEDKLNSAEKVKNDLEMEKDSLNEKLNKIAEGSANMKHQFELKESDVKNQVEALEKKLRVSEQLKRTIEEERNSLYNQLLGDSNGVKLEGMLRETQLYADQVTKLEQELEHKNALFNDMKQKLFASENSLVTQQSVVQRLKKEISNYNMQLENACTELEWFRNQYIEAQRAVIRATEAAAAPGSEIREEDMMLVHQENVNLKKEVTDLLSQLRGKDTALSLPPVKTELFAPQLPTLPGDKSADCRLSSEMKRAELEKLHIEKSYLQKVLTDLKKQVESRPILPQSSDVQPEKMPTQKPDSDFSEDIAKQLAFQADTSTKEEIKHLQSERDYFKNLVDRLQADLQLYTSTLRDKGPNTYTEAEIVKLRKENSDLKSKLVQQHARVKKREFVIRALSSKVVELSQAIKESRVRSGKEFSETEKQSDSVSLLASQIVETSSKTSERSLSKDVVLPNVSSFHFDSEEDSQLLSLLHPSLRQAIAAETEASDLDPKSVQKLRLRIEELENQLEDTRMDNYRLQEEINTAVMKFGIQNNQVVCQKCGKSAEIVSAGGSKSGPKFTSFHSYLEKDPMFSRDEIINKLSESKWKLQNEVLNMQKKLCMNEPSYLENQESFNNHIAKIVSMEYPKIPVRMFSEPLLSATESRDTGKSAQRFELLWKSQVLHLERDIKCLQNYRMFLEQFVFGLKKELTEATKQKPVVVDIPETDTTPAERESGVKPVSPHKVMSSQEAQVLNELPAVRPVPKATGSAVVDDRESVIPVQTSNVPVSGGMTSGMERPAQAFRLKQDAEYVDLQDKIKELSKKTEGLQSENKRLLAENKMLSLECKKCYKSKNRERQLEKQIDDFKHSLKDMNSANRSLQLELEVYHQMFQSDSRDKPLGKHLDGYVKKSYLMRVLSEMKSLNSELERLTQENSMVRKKLTQLQSPAKAVKTRVLLREESSSDKESEGTVTLSRSESPSSLDSAYRYEVRGKKYEGPSKRHMPEYKHFQQEWDLPDFHYDDEAIPFPATRRREKPDSIQDTAAHRPHFSSPDLGIESDPNHELFLSEQAESDEKSYMKTIPPRQLISPTRTKARRPAVDTITAVQDSVKTVAERRTSLHAAGSLEDYELLKKEVDESLVLIRVMSTRAKGCLEYLSRGSNPNKNLGYTTLKEILKSLAEINVCQLKAEELIRSFWVSSVPLDEENVNALIQENQELLRRLEIILEEKKAQKAELKVAFGRVKEAQESKEKMEKAIAKQLTRTKKVLKNAKSNLQGSDQRQESSSFIPQNKNNPSSSNKPSAK